NKNQKLIDLIAPLKELNLGILKIKGVSKQIQQIIDIKTSLLLEKHKFKAKEVEIKHIELAVETYVPLVFSEFFSNTRRFDGKKYGKNIDEFSGEEVLRRLLGGSEITKAEFEGEYYEKALLVKSLIKEEFESIFKKIDAIILPTVPSLPWKIGDKSKMSLEDVYAIDALTIPANLAEVCAISVPAGSIQNIPIGLQIICPKGKESLLFSIAKLFEDLK
ncbi:MAG: amidase family protein, partial [Nanoarchaeota archaeon]